MRTVLAIAGFLLLAVGIIEAVVTKAPAPRVFDFGSVAPQGVAPASSPLSIKIAEARVELAGSDARLKSERMYSDGISWGGLIATGLAAMITAYLSKRSQNAVANPGAFWATTAAVLVAAAALSQSMSAKIETKAGAEKQHADGLFNAIKAAVVAEQKGTVEPAQSTQLLLDLEGAMRP